MSKIHDKVHLFLQDNHTQWFYAKDICKGSGVSIGRVYVVLAELVDEGKAQMRHAERLQSGLYRSQYRARVDGKTILKTAEQPA